MKLSKLTLFSLLIFLSSCFPNVSNKQIKDAMNIGGTMLADEDFKKAIGFIELHKLRYGEYPASLSELKFVSGMDSSIYSSVQYTKLDTAYELNNIYTFPPFGNTKTESVIKLHYPAEFWKGLGCIKSNAK